MRIFWLLILSAIVLIAFVVLRPEPNANAQAGLYYKSIDKGAPLDIYASPQEGAAILGQRESELDFIEVTQSQNGFYRINFGEIYGWIPAGKLEVTIAKTYPQTTLPQVLRCYGEEPFWDGIIANGEIEFSFLSEHSSDEMTAVEAQSDQYEMQLKSGGALIFKQELCQSSMIENAFNWSVQYQTQNEPLQGCCLAQQ